MSTEDILLTDPNDQNKSYQGEGLEVALPYSYEAAEDISEYLAAVEMGANPNEARNATGADGSIYLGAMDASGGLKSGERVPLKIGITIEMTIATGTANISPGNKVKANSAKTCEKVSLAAWPPKNVFGKALTGGVPGDKISVFVWPDNYQ